jgi:hypothetical protein
MNEPSPSDEPTTVWTHPGRLRINELRQQINEHPGTSARQRLHALSRVHGILLANQSELLELIDLPNTDGAAFIALFDINADPETLTSYSQELSRLLHNYVASVKSLVEHSRIQMNKESDAAFLDEYRKQVKESFDGLLPKFVQKLRDYVMHYDVPIGRYTLPLGPSAPRRVRFPISTARLKQWGGWREARPHLDEHPDEIDLRDTVVEYADLVGTFYEWLFNEYLRIHTPAIRDRDILINEHNAILMHAKDGPFHRWRRRTIFRLHRWWSELINRRANADGDRRDDDHDQEEQDV